MSAPLDVEALRRTATEAGVVISLAHALDFDGWDLPGVPEELVAHIAAFDPPTVLDLLDRLDAAEAAAGNSEHDYDRRGERLWRLAVKAGHVPHESDNDAIAELVINEALDRADRLATALTAEEARLSTAEHPDPWTVPMLGNYLGGMKYALSVVRGEA
jgi:hypothetical protein